MTTAAHHATIRPQLDIRRARVERPDRQVLRRRRAVAAAAVAVLLVVVGASDAAMSARLFDGLAALAAVVGAVALTNEMRRPLASTPLALAPVARPRHAVVRRAPASAGPFADAA